MRNAKPMSSPLVGHMKLSSEQSPTSEEKKEKMKKLPYASVVGSSMYAIVCMRLDIAHVVIVNRFLFNPSIEHWIAVKQIMRYLKGTSKVCLCFVNDKSELVGFTDVDMCGDIDYRSLP